MENTLSFERHVKDLADEEKSEQAIEFIGIIVRNWCRKNKLELRWIVLNNVVSKERLIYEKIHSETVEFIKKNPIRRYPEYKKLVLEIAEDMLNKGFINFNDLLLEKNNLAWKQVAGQLKPYAFKWYQTRRTRIDIDINDIHWSAINVLFEKLSSGQLRFTNSFELKSYYFRILENKMKEQFRVIKKEHLMVNELPDLSYEASGFEEDDQILKIKKEIKQLSANEQYIIMEYFLHEKKLSEIAEKMNITAQNCRVIKHRAIQKLMKKVTDLR
jgi:RNA polymerase sigma factor (sigma-70 family)